MIAPGMALIFAGYGVASYGYVLLKGWDITFKQWFSPTNPWTWDSPVTMVPKGQIMPSS